MNDWMKRFNAIFLREPNRKNSMKLILTIKNILTRNVEVNN